MSDIVRIVRVFLASLGDLGEERQLALAEIGRLVAIRSRHWGNHRPDYRIGYPFKPLTFQFMD